MRHKHIRAAPVRKRLNVESKPLSPVRCRIETDAGNSATTPRSSSMSGFGPWQADDCRRSWPSAAAPQQPLLIPDLTTTISVGPLHHPHPQSASKKVSGTNLLHLKKHMSTMLRIRLNWTQISTNPLTRPFLAAYYGCDLYPGRIGPTTITRSPRES